MLILVVSPCWQNTTSREIALAMEELPPEGLKVETLTQPPAAPLQNALYLTDNTAYYDAMRSMGCMTAGYLHAQNQGETFKACPYLISEPQWVDVDSYTKIYQRLAGLPWTILTTERLVIREMTANDIDALYALYDDEARRYMPPLHEDHDVERALLREYIDKVYGMFGYGYWAMTLRDSGRMIGRMGFAAYEGEGSCVSYGYIVHPDYRRKGYALEAAEAILPYARDVLQLPGISAEVHASNEPSISFLKKLGFCKQRVIGNTEVYVL